MRAHATAQQAAAPGLFSPLEPRRKLAWRYVRRTWRWCPAATAASSGGGRPALTHGFAELAAALAPDTLLKADYTPLGRGLVAAQPVAAGTPLLAVDWCHMLAVTDVPSKAGTEFSKRVLQDWQLLHHKMPPLLVAFLLSGEADWFLRLVAWMLFLNSRVEAGPLALYKQLLPQPDEMCCLMNFEPEERQHLQSPGLEALAAKERENILGVHQRMFAADGGELRALRLAGAPGDTLWAACLVNSRCFSETVDGETVSLVVPCADMANHLNNPNAAYAFNPLRDCFELTALRDIVAGEEVCISYGCQNKNNEELMRDYGMVLPANPNDRIPFSSGQDVATQLMLGGRGAPPVALRGQHLQSLVQSHAAAGRLSPAVVGRLPAVLQSLQPFMQQGTLAARRAGSTAGAAAVAAAAALSGATAATAVVGSQAGQGQLGTPGGGGLASSGANLQEERSAVDLLREQCRSMLAAHGTSMETDEELLRGDSAAAAAGDAPLSARARQAVECRLERKRLLAAAEEVLGRYYAEALA